MSFLVIFRGTQYLQKNSGNMDSTGQEMQTKFIWKDLGEETI